MKIINQEEQLQIMGLLRQLILATSDMRRIVMDIDQTLAATNNFLKEKEPKV